ncbi:hypothetical protein FQB35_03025 [Crassaminicella thermophila]|uniref:Uncharacterized protein n=1 Tax=Crassaminicella thermophila TaxID=2599308 RepID=A0A5C0S9Z5_CRATE|nr:hypothetical protein [Crassaminicella thermophila]QEK11425.1 hypothetical protein FQB35_03025 [Crassaminicella thermophila]
MSKISDMISYLGINTYIFLLWGYKMLISSDIPVEISFKEAIFMSFLLILFLAIYGVYFKNTKYILLNILFLFMPLILWFMSMQQALIYHYHKYDTIISILGFFITLIVFLQLIYRQLMLTIEKRNIKR